MLNKNVHTFIGCDAEYDKAKIVLFGAGYDATTSFRPGARFAPSAIRNESFGIETYSPYQDKDLLDCKVFDSGDLELSHVNLFGEICGRVKTVTDDGKIPFMIGGEHSVTFPAFVCAVHAYPDVNIIHFDAHADLRRQYLDDPFSHACVIRRCHEGDIGGYEFGDGRIFQFGIRSGEREEFLYAEKHTHMQKFNFDGLEEVVKKLRGKPVYFTIDLDVLDPSIFPGTGTPEAGGVTFEELRKAATLVCSSCNIVGCDVVELAPNYDPSGVSTAVACKIIREMLLAMS